MKKIFLPERKGERGNVLFLILIAVALFAALSYAVTQSTRSGSKDAGEEQSLISSAQLTTYPAGIRTSIIRMVIGGLSADDLYFNTPSDFGTEISGSNDEARSVFHPAGGGAPYQLAPPELTSTQSQQEWIFSAMYEIEQIGSTNGSNSDGNDLVAFLPLVSRAVCKKINEELGISGGTDDDGDGIPYGGVVTGDLPDFGTHSMTKADPGFRGNGIAIGSGTGSAFAGQPFGCFDGNDTAPAGAAPTAPNYYYHVLIER